MKHLVLSLVMSTFATAAFAENAAPLSPEQTWQLLQDKGDEVLFVDVRDPVEIMFIGFTDAVDINLPFKLVDRHEFIEQKKQFAMKTNPDFVSGVEKALHDKGLDKDALVITMCRSGATRGKPSAEYLMEHGFTNVNYVETGFQGDKAKEGDQKGMRVVNGWMNSDLPWSGSINPDKIYQP
ncbi:rhodanese-like domain-containing protein [Marinobacter salicampi]|uniref:rhodanese-like domain-containing protein n=1 Tax=Marinobacter salicampi TaxID=435907 RepID=UPI00140874EB|nr:rhodanese-like domain-containing protein [Marinobacter salicampi]